MRFGMALMKRKGGEAVRITAKRNNWRPTADEPEVPECLDHVANPYLTKVGQFVVIHASSPSFALLRSYIDGDDPEETAMSQAATRLADRLMVDFGLKKEISTTCGRLYRRGLRNPSAPKLLTHRVFQLVRERIDA